MILIFSNCGRIYKLFSGYTGVTLYRATDAGAEELYARGRTDELTWEVIFLA